MKTKIIFAILCFFFLEISAQDFSYSNKQFAFKIDFPNQYKIVTYKANVIKIVSKDSTNFFMMAVNRLDNDFDILPDSKRNALLDDAKEKFVQSIGVQKSIEKWKVNDNVGYHLVIYNKSYDLDLDYYLIFNANHIYQYTIENQDKNVINKASVKSFKFL